MTSNKSKSNKTFTLKELALRLQGRMIGDADTEIRGIAGIQEAEEGDITFLANPKYRSFVSRTKATALVASQEEPLFHGSVIQVTDPYLAFAQLLEVFYPSAEVLPGIHSGAIVDSTVKAGEGVCIEAGAVLKKGVCIGDRVHISAGVVVGEDSCIGDDSRIHPNVTIYPRTGIGRRVVILAGSVIGSDGFGYARKDGLPYKVPQVGRVVIEDDCEIGANVTIDRGTLGETRIGKGTKIDNLVQIGHNVVVGPYSIIVSQVGISGSTQVGSGVVIAGQAGIAGHLRIGDRVTVAARSGITKSVASEETVGGFMAMPIHEWRKSEAIYRNLPELHARYRELLKRVNDLEERLTSKG